MGDSLAENEAIIRHLSAPSLHCANFWIADTIAFVLQHTN
jgi:hypothetical protein